MSPARWRQCDGLGFPQKNFCSRTEVQTHQVHSIQGDLVEVQTQIYRNVMKLQTQNKDFFKDLDYFILFIEHYFK